MQEKFNWHKNLQKPKKQQVRCKDCEFIAKYRDDVSIFYCTKQHSNRASNGMLKIKANDSACSLFKKFTQSGRLLNY
jgi:ribosomal protein L37AE/L43A